MGNSLTRARLHLGGKSHYLCMLTHLLSRIIKRRTSTSNGFLYSPALISNGPYLPSTYSVVMFPVDEEVARAAGTYFSLQVSKKCKHSYHVTTPFLAIHPRELKA